MFLFYFHQLNIQSGRYNLTPIQNWSICSNLVYDWNPLIWKVWCILPSKNPWHENHHDLNALSELWSSPSNRCRLRSKVPFWSPSFYNSQEVDRFRLALQPFWSHYDLNLFEMIHLIKHRSLIASYMVSLEVENSSAFMVNSSSHPFNDN